MESWRRTSDIRPVWGGEFRAILDRTNIAVDFRHRMTSGCSGECARPSNAGLAGAADSSRTSLQRSSRAVVRRATGTARPQHPAAISAEIRYSSRRAARCSRTGSVSRRGMDGAATRLAQCCVPARPALPPRAPRHFPIAAAARRAVAAHHQPRGGLLPTRRGRSLAFRSRRRRSRRA